MSLTALERAVVASKFRGALVGSLIGDCLGAPFDHDGKVSKVILQKYFDKMEDPSFKCAITLPYLMQFKMLSICNL